MKKLIYLFVACCMGTVAIAQKISEKELQGTWNLTGLNTSGVYLDIATGAITVSEEIKGEVTPEVMEQINAGMGQAREMLKSSTCAFTGNTVSQNMAGQEKTGTYTLKEEAGVSKLLITYSDGTTSEVLVSVKDKKLHIKADGEQNAEFIYSKV